MPFPLAAVPSRNPDIIVLVFDGADTVTVRKTYSEAAHAVIICDGHINRGFEKATGFWFEGEEILPVDVTGRIEDLAEEIIAESNREGAYDRAHVSSFRHPS